MKNILFIVESLSGGGAEKVLLTLTKNINKKKYNITIFSIVETGVYINDLKKYCQIKYALKDYDSYSILGKIMYRIKYKLIYSLNTKFVYTWLIKEKYDIEIAFVEGFSSKLVAASNNLYSKKIAWVHTDMINNPYADKYFKTYYDHYLNYKKFNNIICVSNNVKKVFINKFFYSDAISVQYNPIDAQEIIDKSKESVSFLPEYQGILLGTIGRLEKEKGYIRLIQCADQLVKKGYLFTIWILGTGTQRKTMQNLIKEYSLENYVKLLGFQNNPYKYLVHCDAYICSSYSEGYSTAASESLILGKPIFTVDCSGMRELLGDSKCGIIVENTDEGLYKMLEMLVSGSVNIERYSKSIKNEVKNNRINECILEIEKIFDEDDEYK